MDKCSHPATKSYRNDEGYDVICQDCHAQWASKHPHACQNDIDADKARYDSFMKNQKKGE